MWWWILIGLSIITKVHGFSSGAFPQACMSMSPNHGGFYPQNTEPPFEVHYQHGKEGEPITVFLRSKQPTQFRGFMLEARKKGTVDEVALGKFIVLESGITRLLKCNDLSDSAVSQRNNQRKNLIRVNWTAQEAELDITFRATFVQDFKTFWERVDVDVTLPVHTTPPPNTQPSTPTSTEPSTTTSTTKPSTTSTTKPSTTTTTTKPSTASTTKPSTTTTTTKPSTTSTTKPSTTSTTKPSTTSTTKPSTTTTTTKPSTTTTTIKPSRPTTKPRTTNIMKAGVVLMIFDGLLVVVKMELPNILTITLTNSPFSRCLNEVTKILCSLLCAAVEIPAVILFGLDDSYKVTLIALVCVVTVINFIELVIVSLPIGPSHELKEICDLAVKVCSVIHKILTTAVIFTGVLEIDRCAKNRKESWLLKVMVAYTVWIFLFVIWVFITITHGNAIFGRSKIGSSKNSERWRQQRIKEKLSATKVIAIAVSVILIVGTMSFSVAIIVGIFVCH